jgi:hypothetical protein
MDSTRIKIGQILYGQKEGSEDIAIVKVESVGVGGINYNDTDNSFQYSFDDLFGIPVAANVLLTSGFTLINGMYVNDNIGFIKIKQINGQWFWYADKDKCILVKYLHELQGLYGELTGNVLAVDEDALSIALKSPVVLSAPTGFATSNMTQNTVTITWDGDDDAGGYSYQIDDGELVAADVAEVAKIELTGLSGSTTYTLRVKSIGDNEHFVDSPESEEFKFTTDPLIVLTAPADLTASEIGENNITITWSEVEHASSYEVQIGETTDTTEELIYEFTTLTVNTVYNMSVKAVGDGVTYADSVVAELTKTTLKGKLGTPSVTGEALGTDSVKFSWAAIDNAASYSYSIDAGVTWEPTALLEVTLTELTPGTSYTMSVKAIAASESNYRDSDAGEGSVSTNSE